MHFDLILKNKKYLLSPKSGDTWTMPFYLKGWRLCEISMGYKKAKVKPLAGGQTNNYTVRTIKKELHEMYWYAAKHDATIKAWEQGKKKRPRNWEKEYQ